MLNEETKNLPGPMHRCVGEFWDLLAQRGHLCAAGPAADAPAADRWRHNLAMSQLRQSAPATMTLTELAESIKLPPIYARGYFRAIHELLKEHGVLLLERRLPDDNLLGADDPFLGSYQDPADRDAARVAVERWAERVSNLGKGIKTAEVALKRATKAGGDTSQAEADLATLQGEHLRATAELRRAKTDRLDPSYSQPSRVGYAPLIFPKAMPSDLILPWGLPDDRKELFA